MKIAMALSGGGFRATVFHLGMLARFAQDHLLEEVNFLSTVSGGSLCAGLVFKLNGYQWPASTTYLQQVEPEARRLLTTIDLQKAVMIRAATTFWAVLGTRADDLSALMQRLWGIDIPLKQLPAAPRWMINATCYESGKNFRFERFRMGDYRLGYTYDTDLPLTDAMAASAGFPGLIGPLELKTAPHNWFRYKDAHEAAPGDDPETERQRLTEDVVLPYDELHLWDGGVYDNHGLEGLHSFTDGWLSGVDFLVVSDAAGRSKPERYKAGPKALLRIITGIQMDQIRSLRSRAVVERFVNHDDEGVFLQTGNTPRHVLRRAGRSAELPDLLPDFQPEAEAQAVAQMETHIKQMGEDEYERVFRHGFEVADLTLFAYYSDRFQHVPFRSVYPA
jgi:NTE family protein